jgi:hypothetical protein
MTDRYARYGAATGILFVVLVVITFATLPKPPSSDAPPSEVLTYFINHDSALHVAQLLFAGTAFLFIWFIGTLRAALGASEGGEQRLSGTAYGAGLIAIAVQIVSFALLATATFHAADNGADVTRALNDGAAMAPALAAPALTVFFVANSLVILRHGYLPSWLGWLGMVTALFNAVAIGAVFTDHGAFAPDGALGFFCPFFFFGVWVLAASITLVRRLGEAQRPATAS